MTTPEQPREPWALTPEAPKSPSEQIRDSLDTFNTVFTALGWVGFSTLAIAGYLVAAPSGVLGDFSYFVALPYWATAVAVLVGNLWFATLSRSIAAIIGLLEKASAS